MTPRMVVADEGRTVGRWPVRRHLRAAQDALAVYAGDRGSVPALVLQAEPDGSGVSPWRWYAVGPVAPVSVVRGLAIGGEA